MKSFAVICILLISLTLGAQSAPRAKSLLQDLLEINSVLERKDIQNLIHDYAVNDPEVKATLAYMQSEEVNEVLQEFTRKPEVERFYQWVAAHINRLMRSASDESSEDSNENEYEEFMSFASKRTGGWKGLIKDIAKIFPVKEFREMIAEKKAEGGEFAQMMEEEAKLKPVYDAFLKEPKTVEVIKHLESLGFDFESFDRIIRSLYGWN